VCDYCGEELGANRSGAARWPIASQACAFEASRSVDCGGPHRHHQRLPDCRVGSSRLSQVAQEERRMYPWRAGAHRRALCLLSAKSWGEPGAARPGGLCSQACAFEAPAAWTVVAAPTRSAPPDRGAETAPEPGKPAGALGVHF